MSLNQLEECFSVKVVPANFVDHKYGYVFLELIYQYLEIFNRLAFVVAFTCSWFPGFGSA